MDDESRDALQQLLSSYSVAALATVSETGPAVSMVPYAAASDGSAIYIHVSRLARHTGEMLDDPRVALMIMEPESAGSSSLALARLSIEGEARELAHDSAEYMSARAAYVGRHPQSEMMFGFADFSLFAITPAGGRFVGGFARAHDISPEELAQFMRSLGESD